MPAGVARLFVAAPVRNLLSARSFDGLLLFNCRVGLALGGFHFDMGMMRKVIWSLLVLILLGLGVLLHWTLPSRDVVRILGTDVAREQVVVTNPQGEDVIRSRDIRYINAVSPDGDPMVYRNMDTGWGWPPYFKFDSANLAAEAQNLTSTDADPRWMIVKHYGWRIPIFSTFPNAISISPAEGPDQTVIPWVKIIVLALLIGFAAYLWYLVHNIFKRRDAAKEF